MTFTIGVPPFEAVLRWLILLLAVFAAAAISGGFAGNYVYTQGWSDRDAVVTHVSHHVQHHQPRTAAQR